MKILQVVHGWPPASLGGTERFAQALSHELAHRHQVEIFCATAEPELTAYAQTTRTCDGLTVYGVNNRLTDLGSFEMLYRNAAVTRAFRSVLRRSRPDLVHLHHLYLLSTDIVNVIRDAGVPIVMTLHDYWMICQRGQFQKADGTNCAKQVDSACDTCLPAAASLTPTAVGLSRRLDRWVPGFANPNSLLRKGMRQTYHALAGKGDSGGGADIERITRRQAHIRDCLEQIDRFVAPSRYLMEKFLAFGIPESKIVQCDYGTVLEGLEPATTRPDGPVRIGFLGSLIPSKGAHILVEAYRTLPEPKAPLFIAGGSGSDPGMQRYEETLRRQIKATPVTLHGRYDPHQTGDLLRNLDLLVVPSLWQENSPVVIHEAIACGIPVIGSRIGGIPELVEDGVNGRLFEPGHVAALAQILRSLSSPAAVADLKKRLRPVKPIADNCLEYETLYHDVTKIGTPTTAHNKPARVGAIILNYNSTNDTLACIAALQQSDYPNLNILVVDNGSVSPPDEAIRTLDGIDYLALHDNLGYAGGNNAGMRLAIENGADYLFLINADAAVAPGTIGAMVAAGNADPTIGILGATVYDMDQRDRLQSAGSWFNPTTGRAMQIGYGQIDRGQFNAIRDVDGVHGCSMMIRAGLVHEVGGLAEEFFCYFEETEWALRAANAGWRVVRLPEAKVWHKGFGSSGGGHTPESLYYSLRNQLLTVARHGEPLCRFRRTIRQARLFVWALAHMTIRSGVPKWAGLGALVKGLIDYNLGRLGKRTE